MGVRVSCPGCRAGMTVSNARYRVVIRCYACGQEFLAEGHEGPEPLQTYPPGRPVEFWREPEPAGPNRNVLTFCPMCGELAAESAQACPACGEPLPDDRLGNGPKDDVSRAQARRFRRQARLLGVLWIFLAFLLAEHDVWLSEFRLELPAFLSGQGVMIPPIPLLATFVAAVGVFALVGAFWAVAVGWLLNYLLLFLMVWNANAVSLVLLAGIVILTHITLNQAASARLR